MSEIERARALLHVDISHYVVITTFSFQRVTGIVGDVAE
jgi:hypothetical protein